MISRKDLVCAEKGDKFFVGSGVFCEVVARFWQAVDGAQDVLTVRYGGESHYLHMDGDDVHELWKGRVDELSSPEACLVKASELAEWIA
jgi:hypothetical protein